MNPRYSYSLLNTRRQFDRAGSFLTVDHRIACQSGEGKAARALAGVMVAIFPIGVPLALFTQLFIHRRQIMERETRSGDSELGYIGTTTR